MGFMVDVGHAVGYLPAPPGECEPAPPRRVVPTPPQHPELPKLLSLVTRRGPRDAQQRFPGLAKRAGRLGAFAAAPLLVAAACHKSDEAKDHPPPPPPPSLAPSAGSDVCADGGGTDTHPVRALFLPRPAGGLSPPPPGPAHTH